MRKRLGELLLDARKLTEKDLLRALTEQKEYGEKLGKVIVKLGMLSEKEIIDTVSKQLNIPIVDIKDMQIPEDVISLITADMAKNAMVIPVMRRLCFPAQQGWSMPNRNTCSGSPLRRTIRFSRIRMRR